MSILDDNTGVTDMDIKNFIEDTISQIMAGIESKNEKAEDKFRLVKGVNFDLAVTVSTNSTEEKSVNGGGRIKIASIDTKKGVNTSESNTVVSRVNFTIGQKPQWDF